MTDSLSPRALAAPRKQQNEWKQKRHGEKSTLAHPYIQAFALPLSKDKQRSQPTPSGIIHTTLQLYIIIYSSGWDITRPNADAYRCITSVESFKVAKFECTENNVV